MNMWYFAIVICLILIFAGLCNIDDTLKEILKKMK